MLLPVEEPAYRRVRRSSLPRQLVRVLASQLASAMHVILTKYCWRARGCCSGTGDPGRYLSHSCLPFCRRISGQPQINDATTSVAAMGHGAERRVTFVVLWFLKRPKRAGQGFIYRGCGGASPELSDHLTWLLSRVRLSEICN